MANFSDLPTEIWLLIARYLRDPKLCELKSLNSFFLCCWMDRRWQKGIIDFGAPDIAVRVLQRVADPFVATKMKGLHMSAYEGPDIETLDIAAAILLQTLPLMPNITTLDIHLFENTFHLTSLFQTILHSTIARTLQKLSLTGSLKRFSSIVEYFKFAHTKNLTELCLILMGTDSLNLSSVILAPIVFSLAPNLQLLRVSHQFSTVDLSPLFDAICQVLFANLKSLILNLSNSSFLDSRSFHRFLRTLSNDLHHLQIQHAFWSLLISPNVEVSLSEWLIESVNNCRFSSLQSLTIRPPRNPLGLQAVLTLIKHVAPTMSSLTICDYLLSEEDAGQILDALTESLEVPFESGNKQKRSNLKSLSMEIDELSIPFLELLARKLPQLEKLTLDVRQSIGSDQNSFYHNLLNRRYDREITSSQDILHAWKLRDLSITRGSTEKDAVRVVAGAVPGLAHLVGKGVLKSIAFPNCTFIEIDSD